MAEPAIDWLLKSDPSIRWQVMRDLTAASDSDVAAERARVAHEGWGARLLELQRTDGGWGASQPTSWVESPDGSSTYALTLLRQMGLDPTSKPARRAIQLVRDRVTYIWQGGIPYFGGETEACINGMMLAVGGYFGEVGEPLRGVVDRLLSEQLDDGGWNCDAPESRRSSFNSTICVLEGLLEWERASGPDTRVTDARRRGEDYLLERRMFRRLSNGEIVDLGFTRFAFPPGWHYDVLRGLDYLRNAGVKADDRIAEAVQLVADHRRADGRWVLESRHPGLDSDAERDFWESLDFGLREKVGEPSYWVTLRALQVLKWARLEWD
jgi:hypothetical protein